MKLILSLLFIVFFCFFLIDNCFPQDYWSPTSTINAPLIRTYHSAVWAGNKMVIWGGYKGHGINTGGLYDISTKIWTPTSLLNAPVGRYMHTALWTGNLMIVWGGYGTSALNSGGIYDPVLNNWTNTSIENVPSERWYHTAIWTGNKMIIWGGYSSPTTVINTGGIYDPALNNWTQTSTTDAPIGRCYHTAVWTGSKMIVWGGSSLNNYINTGGIYDPVTNTWTPTSLINAPSIRGYHTAIWTGSKMIIWGGLNRNGCQNSGASFDPETNTWTPISTVNAPTARGFHTAIWTGNKMFVWGGNNGITDFNTGGIYDPVTDLWTSLPLTDVPSPRSCQTAVWTGNKMIIWGGNSFNTYLNTGGILLNNLIANAGNDTTILCGYGNQNANLSATVSGGLEPYAYQWSNGETSSTITVSPDVTTEYIVTVTDASSHSAQDTVKVNVIDIRCGNNNKKVLVCHKGNTICISPNAVPAHLEHGDYLGECTNNGITGIFLDKPKDFVLYTNFPNPFNATTRIKFDLPVASNVKLSIYDLTGREVSKLINAYLKVGTYCFDWNANEFSSGIYFYKFESNNFTKVMKMILVK